MNAISKLAFVAASLFAANFVFGQASPTAPAMNVLIGGVSANDAQAASADKFAELLTKYSNGRLKASARNGGSLGTNAQMLAVLQAGSLHAMIGPSGSMATAVPELGLFDMPFLLPGAPANITAFAAQSKAAARMMELAEQKGIRILGFHGIGPQSLLTRFPVNKVADIQGKNLRVIPSPARLGSLQDWGVVARPMEFAEIYTSLQQGTIDGLTAAPDITLKSKWHEVAKYLTITEHFAFASILQVSKKWFDGLPKDLQDVVIRTGKETIAFADGEFAKAQDSSLEVLRKTITVTNMPAAELEKMKDLTRKGVWERMKADPQRGPFVKLLEEDLARYNKK
jgi:TRAP-type C4-dicarboxylate transport system substrate-binding protein